MEKKLRIATLILWIIVAVLLVWFMFYLFNGGASGWGLHFGNGFINVGGDMKECIDQSFSAGEYGSVSVDCSVADIRIEPSETDAIRVVIETTDSDEARDAISVGSEDGTLYIRQKPINGITLFNNFTAKVVIELPEDYAGNVSISSSVGDISLSGSYALGQLSLHSSTGDITAQTLSVASFSANASVGDIEIGELESKDISVELATGDVSVGRVSGAGKFRSHVGDVKISLMKLTGDMNIGTSTGSVRVRMDKDISLYIEAKTSTGDIDSDFALSYSGFSKNRADGQIGGKPEYTLSLDTSVGGIRLENG